MAFKSNDRTFEKVYGIFDKRDYFNAQGLAKVQIGNFERALQRNDKGAQQILDKFKGDMGKAKEYITQVITDRKKEQAFNDYKAFKVAVDSIQKGKPQYGAVDLVKSRIHNSSQKYTIALYSALRNKKFTKWKDVHNDVDSLIGESVNEGKVHFEKKLKSGNIFQVIDRDTKGMRGTQDKFSMQIVDKRGKVIKHIGSHPSLNGAKKYSDSIKEGKKRFYQQDGIGKAKYTISYHDGKQKHKDGSDFYGIQIFRNQKDLEKFRTALLKKGYREDSGYKKESVNEKYSGNSNDFKYDLENALDNIGISYKAIKKISKKGKGFEVRMSSYMKNRDAWEKLGKEMGAKLVDFKPGSINIGLYESKSEVEQIAKKTKSETAFYDVLSKIEKKYGKKNYRLWLEKSLKDLGVNPKHYDYRTNAAAEEKLYQLTKWN